DDHALAALDDADAGDDPGARRGPVVEIPRGERGELEECASRVDEPVDPLARRQLPARPVPLDGPLAAAACDLRSPLAQLRDETLHALAASGVLVGRALDLRAENGYGRTLPRSNGHTPEGGRSCPVR